MTHKLRIICLVLLCGWFGQTKDVSAAWRWLNADPQGFNLKGVCAGSDSEFIAVGAVGKILRWDGVFWHEMHSGTHQNLNGVARSGHGEYIAVGEGGTIIRWSNSQWLAMQSPTDLALKAVCFTDTGRGFAVGAAGTALMWNGTAWNLMHTPVDSDLASVWSASETDVWAVGSNGTAIRWNGSEWTLYSTGTSCWFTGISGTSPMNVYAFGSAVFSPEIYHFDGTTWTAVDHGITFGYGEYFTSGGMWCAGADEIYAVGSTIRPGDHSPLPRSQLIHFTESDWSRSAQGYGAVNSVSGYASGEPVVVGDYGILRRKTDAGWQTDSRVFEMSVRGIHAIASDKVYVLDAYSYPYFANKINYWNGSVWNTFYIDMQGGNCLNIWVTGMNEIYAIGTNGAAARYNGTTWTSMDTGTTHHLRHMWKPDPDNLYAVGDAGTILRLQNSAWQSVASGTSVNLNAIWGFNASIMFVVGESGTILQGDGTNLQSVISGTTANLNSVHGLSSGPVFAAGDAGTLLRRDGNEWFQIESPDTGDLRAVRVVSPNEVYLAGDSGVFRWNGAEWHNVLPVATARAFSSLPSGEVFLAVESGVMQWTGEFTGQALQIRIPEPFVHPGDEFFVQAYLYNSGPEALAQVPTYIILDVFGELFFWPSWCLYAPPEAQAIDCAFTDVPIGITSLQIIPPFTWPNTGSASVDGLYFYGAMLNPGQTAIIGQMSVVRWGYGAAE